MTLEDKQRSGVEEERAAGPGLSGLHVLRLWLTAADACQELGVVPRTLRKYVTRGYVTRKRVGRESRYRIISAPTTARAPVEQGSRPLTQPGPLSGQRTGPLSAEPRPGVPALGDSSALAVAHRQVLELNQQLAEEVDELNGDLVRLADENAGLRAELEESTAAVLRADGLVDLATELLRRRES